ncbi:hypothetical protein [Sphingomonas sp.]|uniref:hypothetical protein n=1 Tax=Sphingomonas sp. TaxID=28214 RepID=UPI0031DD7FFC
MRIVGAVDRRSVLAGLGGSGLVLAGLPGRAVAGAADRRRDWAWLEGNWQVEHRWE